MNDWGERGRFAAKDVDVLPHILRLHQRSRARKYTLFTIHVNEVPIHNIPSVGAFETHAFEPHRFCGQILYVNLEEHLLSFEAGH
jgi:hypothetical protein